MAADRRVDQSMSLLTELQDNALEPGYRMASQHGTQRSTWRRLVALGLLAALLVVGATRTLSSSSDLADERAELIDHIAQGQALQEDLEAELGELQSQVRELQDLQVTDPTVRSGLDQLSPITGAVPVTGPGIVITVDDANNRSGAEGLVYDTDLVRLVNGLRQAGAEAITINDRRITTLTPIRTAGSAITIDYVSQSPPYVVEVIGDPNTLQARFARTTASVWWQHISENFGVGFQIREADGDLEMAADPGMTLRFAEA